MEESPKSRSRSLTFWEVVCAVVVGMIIYQWLKDLKSEPETMSWVTPLFWAGVIIYVVGSVIIEQWKDRKWSKEFDKNQLELARSHGFESFPEYMVVHGTDDYVRKSWEKKAAEEKAKREKRTAIKGIFKRNNN